MGTLSMFLLVVIFIGYEHYSPWLVIPCLILADLAWHIGEQTYRAIQKRRRAAKRGTP